MTTGVKIIPFLLLALVSACANRTFSVSIERMETETASSASLSLPPTWTPSPTFSPRSTPTPFPTYTPVPPLASVLPTISSRQGTLVVGSEKALLSPNGQWSASFDSGIMQVVNQNTGKVWTLPCTLFKECFAVRPVKWSSDSSNLFFAPEAIIFEAPIGVKAYTAVAKIDVKTGVWEKLLEETDRYYDFAVSNNDAYLAYTQPVEKIENKSVILSIMNLKNSHETKYRLDGFKGGNILWSPYTSRFVFQIQDPVSGFSSLVYYDVDLDVLKYILKEKMTDYQIETWGEDNLVSLQKFTWTDRTFSDWVLNPFTNEITPVPTPN